MLMRQYQHVDESVPLTPQDLESLIGAIQHVCRREIDGRLRVFGMSTVQWQALDLIREHPGLPQGQLARLMGQSEQAFGTLLARLLVRGYLERRRARGYAATHDLTALGRIMLQHAQVIAGDALALLFAPLTGKDRESLRVLLMKVLRARWRLRFHPVPECP
jgi:DNA-binding MarR family transcriptional regulator